MRDFPVIGRLLYTLLLIALLPWGLLHLLWRSRLQADYLRHWGERFGFYATRPEAPVIWLHAVSVGEARAAQTLVAALHERFPRHRILMTHMTPTGRQTGIALFGDSIERAYLAYDYPICVARFLDHWQPELGIVMETELWPNLIHACAHRGIPLLLANARLSARSARRYALFPALTRSALGRLAGVAAQAEPDAERLRALGAADVEVLGNLKFDITPPPTQLALGGAFRDAIGMRPVLLCASTREGEEGLILDAWKQARRSPDALLVIVPRHPQRCDAVAAMVRARGFRTARRSERMPAPETEVWLGDSLGEMFAYYAACDVAFVGGSLLDFGCQNLIEPCALGKPVLIGPSTFNFAQAAADAVAAGACRQVRDASELCANALSLLENDGDRLRMGQTGLAFAAAHRGATARTLEWILRKTTTAAELRPGHASCLGSTPASR